MAGLLLTLPIAHAIAGSIQITPTGLQLSERQPIGTFTVHNSGDRTTTVQAETFLWDQNAGRDLLTPNRELLVTPPIFTLAPGATQVVRAGLRRPFAADRELSYRAIFREIPSTQATGGAGLNLALRISVPVFAASTSATQPALQWRIERAGGRNVRLHARNTGGAHAKLVSLQLHDARTGAPLGKEVRQLAYVLPGEEREWRLTLDRPLPAGAQVKIRAGAASGDIDASAAVP